jgi:hypothetical protein
VTNVVAVFVIAVTFLPILAAFYLTRDEEPGRRTARKDKAIAPQPKPGDAP